jgi:hypothetical protein
MKTDWFKWIMTAFVIPLLLGSFYYTKSIADELNRYKEEHRREVGEKLDKVSDKVNGIDNKLTEVYTLIKYAFKKSGLEDERPL